MEDFYEKLFNLLTPNQRQNVKINLEILNEIDSKKDKNKVECFRRLEKTGFEIDGVKIIIDFETIKNRYWKITKK